MYTRLVAFPSLAAADSFGRLAARSGGASKSREETQERATDVGPVKNKEKKREREGEREREGRKDQKIEVSAPM